MNYEQRVLRDEILQKNPNAKILPTVPEPKVLPPIELMEAVWHKTCGGVAFYYTHRPQPGEMMTAVRARTKTGKRIEKGEPMMCGSCGINIEGPHVMRMRK